MNEDALIERLEQLGFFIFEPEQYSFVEQVKTFSAAKLVVGPSGAGMFNTVFCPRGTRILSIEPLPTWMVQHANLFGGRGHAYAMIAGGADAADPSVQKRWRADIDTVVRRVQDMM